MPRAAAIVRKLLIALVGLALAIFLLGLLTSYPGWFFFVFALAVVSGAPYLWFKRKSDSSEGERAPRG
ncbi:hypothetical protein BZB76_6554 [Actinomadura pelletieri DSM 43383]|uniref:Uncharacterized protein n=1 Tax=Actinomadura pelletieri DSM 43383 TaxID=1120940 RepID=A0A495Q9Y6_9ACTN|nr:hypothetical protein [Actinomadura pelletieri]RKS68293.1 hypothetical protein BZB76_6554 [Actinomadura pelletieri DSM 43383]